MAHQHAYPDENQQKRPPFNGVPQEIPNHALMENAGIFQQCNHADNNQDASSNHSPVALSHEHFPFNYSNFGWKTVCPFAQIHSRSEQKVLNCPHR
jgi:hypothetical protein